MVTMMELREKRRALDQEMTRLADSQGGVIEQRIIDFLDSLEAEFGLFRIDYELSCFWEDEDQEPENKIGFKVIHVCNT